MFFISTSGKELSLFAFVFFLLSSTLSLFFLQSACLQSKMFPNCYYGLSTSTRPSEHKQYSNSAPTLFCYKLKYALVWNRGNWAFPCSQTKMKRWSVHVCMLVLRLYVLGQTVWRLHENMSGTDLYHLVISWGSFQAWGVLLLDGICVGWHGSSI